MALDHSYGVRRLAVLDILPTVDVYRGINADFVRGFWVWSFLPAPEPVPERLIAGAPDVFVNYMLDTWAEDPSVFTDDIRAEYIAKFRDPDAVHAICEEYRAAATLDVKHDEADRGRRRIHCPTLVLWSARGGVSLWDAPLDVWKTWADDVRGVSMAAGHFLPEEDPDETARQLLEFLD
jgi:haloacetate dehalogenase